MPPHYPDKLKQKITSQFQSGSSVQDLEKKYKIPSSTIYRWVKGCQRCLTVQGQNFSASDISRLLNEVERLRKENEILHMSNPGDYDYDEDDYDSPDYEIVEID